jgi:hypothetical protein
MTYAAFSDTEASYMAWIVMVPPSARHPQVRFQVCSPLLRKSGAGRTAATRNQPVPRREVWLLREQLDRLVEAIDPRYRALVWSRA